MRLSNKHCTLYIIIIRWSKSIENKETDCIKSRYLNSKSILTIALFNDVIIFMICGLKARRFQRTFYHLSPFSSRCCPTVVIMLIGWAKTRMFQRIFYHLSPSPNRGFPIVVVMFIDFFSSFFKGRCICNHTTNPPPLSRLGTGFWVHWIMHPDGGLHDI